MNCNRLKFCRIFMLLFLLNSHCFAQGNNISTDSVTTSNLADSIAYNDESVDTAIIKSSFNNQNDSVIKWKKTPDFSYMSYLDSLLRRKKSQLRMDTFNINEDSNHKRKTYSTPSDSNSSLNSLPFKIFFWIVAVFFIGFILYKLFIKGGLFDKEPVKYDRELSAEEPEKLNEYSVYNDLIYNAETKNDFNQAIRYLYLQTLKKLSDGELILFASDKTNSNYVKELSGREYQKDFALLTRNYEYVWYGKFIIDNNKYKQLKDQFISFNKKV